MNLDDKNSFFASWLFKECCYDNYWGSQKYAAHNVIKALIKSHLIFKHHQYSKGFFLDFSRFKRFWKKVKKILKSSVYFYSFLNANSKLCRPHFGASWSWFAHTTSKYEKPANLQQSWTWDFLLMLWIWLTRHSAV